ncbi:MAG: TonB-dependent receptor [Cyclobacteriaceae bacterium]|nr:TonB-dependent receptor [Cyclobacteriaceae bacterium]
MRIFYKKVHLATLVLLVSLSTGLLAQSRTVSGRVLSSDDGAPVPGVNVLEKGTNNGVVTDSDGRFSIRVGGPNSVLVFSFVGYATQEVAVGNQTTIDVTLQVQVSSLEEVVVIGYGQVEKKDLTGSIVSVNQASFNKGVMASPQDLLVGKVAGVVVTQGSGAPGSGAQIRIRGGSSVNASNDPLIVVDGFPLDNSGVAGMSNSLSTINPNDIETITVLKDASATAIYGARASNGVIIITTKKGAVGKPTLNYNAQVSLSTLARKAEVLTGDEYRDLIQGLVGNYGIDAAAASKLGNENTDWQDEVFRNAVSTDHLLSLSGSTKNIPYRVSYGFTDQQGILKTTSMQRHSFNINVSPTLLNDNLRINAGIKGMHTRHNFGDEGAIGSAVSFDPTQPVRNGNTRWGGYFTWTIDPNDPNSDASAIAPRNPVARLELTDNRSKVFRYIANLEADYRFSFLPELRAHLNMGIDHSKSEGFNNVSPLAPWTSELGSRTDYTGENQSRLLDLYLNYSKILNDHKIDFTAGYSYQSFQRDGSNFSRSFDGSVYYDYEVTQDGDTVARKFIPNPNYLISFFGRANYNYKGKYLVTATLRTDGSSRFSEDNRWGLFPAVAVAWRLKSENFLADARSLSDLKLRLGYGVTGQQDVGGAYPYLPVYVLSTPTAQYQFGNTFYQTFRPSAYDASFKWEETITYNAGVDFGLFSDRITASVDYYFRESRDLINTIPIPAGSNFNNFLTTNIGNLENRGVEVTLNAKAVKTNTLTWDIGFNLSHNKNKITKLTATDDPNYQGINIGGISGGVGNTIQNNNVGFPQNSFFVFQQIYDANGRPIEGLYVDRTGNGGNVVSNQLNKYHYKQPAPIVLMGFTSMLTYKNFDFFMAGRVSLGNYVYNNGASNTFYQAAFNNNTVTFNNLRRFIYDSGFASAQYWSDFYVENGSFFKMDNMSLGYTASQLFTQKLKARFSFTVQNAFMITKYSGIDPEIANGIDNNLYPRPRVFLFGVNLTY